MDMFYVVYVDLVSNPLGAFPNIDAHEATSCFTYVNLAVSDYVSN